MRVTDEQLDLLFKALANRVRRRIIDRLSRQTGQLLLEVCAAFVAESDAALSRQAIPSISMCWNVPD